LALIAQGVIPAGVAAAPASGLRASESPQATPGPEFGQAFEPSGTANWIGCEVAARHTIRWNNAMCEHAASTEGFLVTMV
jgi:hypothetical protein